MAQVIYYLEFSDIHPVPSGSPLHTNFPNGRRHQLKIIDNDLSGTDVTTPNIIGDRNPVNVIWDNTDDIYNSIMPSRMEMNFLSDDVKMINVEEIISNDDPSRFEAKLYIANASGGFDLYWNGYITNVEFEQQINSVPVPYKLIATDLLTSLKNITTLDGTALISPQQTIIGYIENVLGFLPYGAVQNIRIYNNIRWKVSAFVAYYLQDLPFAYAFENGLDFQYKTAYEYLENVLRMMNARLFVAEQKFYIIPNTYGSTTMDAVVNSISSDWDNYENSLLDLGTTFQVTFKEYVFPTSYFTVTKDIDLVVPTDLKEVNQSLKIRYEAPIDKVIFEYTNNPYAANFNASGLSEAFNYTSYPSIEKTATGILYNQTYFSDDFSVITTSQVKSGNYSFKSNQVSTSNFSNFVSTDRLFDTGFSQEYIPTPDGFNWFNFEVYPEDLDTNTDHVDLRFEVALCREIGGTKQYYDNFTWTNFTVDTDIKLQKYDVTLNLNQWNNISGQGFGVANGISPTPSPVKYRLIIFKPKTSATGITYHYDNCFLHKTISFPQEEKITLEMLNSASQRDANTKNITLKNPISGLPTFGNFDTPRISGTTYGVSELIGQEILNDNRQHIRKFSIVVKALDGYQQFIFPWHKIWINYSGYETKVLGIIDRLQYSARDGVWKIEFHIPVQTQSVSTTKRVTSSKIIE